MKCERACETCKTLQKGKMHVHDFLPALDTSAGYDEASLEYTSLPVPFQLTVRPSSIPGAGLGVFANTFISSNVRIGLFEGKTVSGEQMKECDTAYAWEIDDSQQRGPYLIDGKDPAHANWLRYVNCARYSEEQNLIAYQYKGNIYYRTIRHIYRNDELLVWYGNDYAKELGLNTNSPDLALMNCQFCGDFIEKQDQDKFLQGDTLSLKRTFNGDLDCKNYSRIVSLEHASVEKQRSERSRSNICQICDKSFYDKSTLKRHLITHSKIKPFRCSICKQSFSRKSNLKAHEMRIHSTYNCLYCSYSANDKRIFSRHEAWHKNARHGSQKMVKRNSLNKSSGKCGLLHAGNGIRKEKCLLCKKEFDAVSKLKIHISLVHRPFQCNICKKRLGSKEYLKKHREIHEGKSYRCNLCGKSYSRGDTLSRHVKKVHSKNLHCFKCKCGKAFNHEWSMMVHMRNTCTKSGHLSLPRHDTSLQKLAEPCMFCKRIVSGYYNHMASHMYVANCDQHEIAMKLKMMFESNKKVYGCNKCGASFLKRHSLGLHQIVHSGRPVFKCEYCRKNFDEMKLLNEHLKTHLVARRVKCEFCKSYYCNMSTLRRHLRNIHADVPKCRRPQGHLDTMSEQENNVMLRHFTVDINRLPLNFTN